MSASINPTITPHYAIDTLEFFTSIQIKNETEEMHILKNIPTTTYTIKKYNSLLLNTCPHP